MRGVYRAYFFFIHLLRSLDSGTGRSIGLLRCIELTFARRKLLLHSGMRVACVERILFCQSGVVTRLFQFSVGNTGAILAL